MEFHQHEQVAGLREGGKDGGVGEVVGCVGEAWVDAAEKIEDELGFGDVMADVVQNSVMEESPCCMKWNS